MDGQHVSWKNSGKDDIVVEWERNKQIYNIQITVRTTSRNGKSGKKHSNYKFCDVFLYALIRFIGTITVSI
jgi:hypothetical protein